MHLPFSARVHATTRMRDRQTVAVLVPASRPTHALAFIVRAVISRLLVDAQINSLVFHGSTPPDKTVRALETDIGSSSTLLEIFVKMLKEVVTHVEEPSSSPNEAIRSRYKRSYTLLRGPTMPSLEAGLQNGKSLIFHPSGTSIEGPGQYISFADISEDVSH